MTTPLLLPLDIGRFGHPGPGPEPVVALSDAGPPFASFFGVAMMFLFLLLLAATFFFLARSGRIGPPLWAQSRAPESEAKRVLADRFARGDISTDEFMERASVLNWTPGSDPYDNWKPRKKRR